MEAELRDRGPSEPRATYELTQKNKRQKRQKWNPGRREKHRRNQNKRRTRKTQDTGTSDRKAAGNSSVLNLRHASRTSALLFMINLHESASPVLVLVGEGLHGGGARVATKVHMGREVLGDPRRGQQETGREDRGRGQGEKRPGRQA